MLHRRQTPKACRCKVFQHLQALIAAAAGFVAGAGNTSPRADILLPVDAQPQPLLESFTVRLLPTREWPGWQTLFPGTQPYGPSGTHRWAAPCSPAPIYASLPFPQSLRAQMSCWFLRRRLRHRILPAGGLHSASLSLGGVIAMLAPMLEDLGRAQGARRRPLCLPCIHRRGTADARIP